MNQQNDRLADMRRENTIDADPPTEEERRALYRALDDCSGLHGLDHIMRACSLDGYRTIEVLDRMVLAGLVETYGRMRYRRRE